MNKRVKIALQDSSVCSAGSFGSLLWTFDVKRKTERPLDKDQTSWYNLLGFQQLFNVLSWEQRRVLQVKDIDRETLKPNILFYTVIINVHNHKINLHWTPTHQPCLCLCLGFVLQKTNRQPRRLTKKQSLQRLLRDDLVFIPAEGWMQARWWHCPKSDGPWWWLHEPGEGVWTGTTLADDRNRLRWATVRVQRRLKALVTGNDTIRFSRLTWTTCWVRLETRPLRSRGVMMVNAGSKTEQDQRSAA